MSPKFKPVFSRDGLLSLEFKTFEYRPEQEKMAGLVQKSFEQNKHCVVEAGTGTGKSLAYLFPVALSGQTTVISTETKNLQDQLYYKDFPIVQDIIRKYAQKEVKCGIAKGRGNYLCPRRLRKYGSKMEEGIISSDYETEYKRLVDWSQNTEDGDFDSLDWEVPIALKERVKSSSEDCLGYRCFYAKCRNRSGSTCNKNNGPCAKRDCIEYDIPCFKERRRKYLSHCNIVIANHALYMIDVFADFDVLPPHTSVILDEAQHIYDRAVEALSTDVSNFKIRDLVSDIKALPVFINVAEVTVDIEKETNKLVKFSDEFFNTFVEYAKFVDRREEIEFPEDYRVDLRDVFITKVQEMQKILEEVIDYTVGDESVEIDGYIRRCEDFVENLKKVTTISEHSVNWAVVKKREKRMSFVSLNTAPIVVSEQLVRSLFNKRKSVILTSATIAIGTDFEFFKHQLGVPDNAIEGVIGSPFDYKHNCCLYLSTLNPDDDDFDIKTIKIIKDALEISKGRAFCLFTSYKAMNNAYEAVNGNISYEVLKQGQMPRPALIKKFLETGNCVLFGTSSFWEGVSIEGEKLSAVIIDKIPFPVPTDPIMAAKIRKAKNEFGDRWFSDYYLPIAILKLKQGFGRLIRTKDDRGFVAILDGRMRTKYYGKKILASLPPAKRVSTLKAIDTV